MCSISRRLRLLHQPTCVIATEAGRNASGMVTCATAGPQNLLAFGLAEVLRKLCRKSIEPLRQSPKALGCKSVARCLVHAKSGFERPKQRRIAEWLGQTLDGTLFK